jgi:hypothetical protein
MPVPPCSRRRRRNGQGMARSIALDVAAGVRRRVTRPHMGTLSGAPAGPPQDRGSALALGVVRPRPARQPPRKAVSARKRRSTRENVACATGGPPSQADRPGPARTAHSAAPTSRRRARRASATSRRLDDRATAGAQPSGHVPCRGHARQRHRARRDRRRAGTRARSARPLRAAGLLARGRQQLGPAGARLAAEHLSRHRRRAALPAPRQHPRLHAAPPRRPNAPATRSCSRSAAASLPPTAFGSSSMTPRAAATTSRTTPTPARSS